MPKCLEHCALPLPVSTCITRMQARSAAPCCARSIFSAPIQVSLTRRQVSRRHSRLEAVLQPPPPPLRQARTVVIRAGMQGRALELQATSLMERMCHWWRPGVGSMTVARLCETRCSWRSACRKMRKMRAGIRTQRCMTKGLCMTTCMTTCAARMRARVLMTMARTTTEKRVVPRLRARAHSRMTTTIVSCKTRAGNRWLRMATRTSTTLCSRPASSVILRPLRASWRPNSATLIVSEISCKASSITTSHMFYPDRTSTTCLNN
mmetsp:Transcript_44698/g.65538  ORF Transcript_44698/g.65538 Transcript_44698/m.65538 type:complete len:264 (-) Transcript_44698:6038-6829(-)